MFFILFLARKHQTTRKDAQEKPSKSTGAAKLPNFFEVPEEEFRSRGKTKKVCQILRQTTNNTTNNPEQTTPTVSP